MTVSLCLLRFTKVDYRQVRVNVYQGLYFSKALYEGLIFGGAYIRRGLSTEGNLRFKTDWASLTAGSKLLFLLCFTLYLRAIFQVKAPGGLYLEGRLNGGFFALPVWGAYIWRGLFSEFIGIFPCHIRGFISVEKPSRP